MWSKISTESKNIMAAMGAGFVVVTLAMALNSYMVVDENTLTPFDEVEAALESGDMPKTSK